MALVLTPGLAETILRNSENVHGGHTLSRHVNLSNAQLQERYETQDTSGNIKVFTAFRSVADCAEALCYVVNNVLQREDFFRVFYKQENGQKFNMERIECPRTFTVRMGRGPLQTNYLTLWAQKIDTFSPTGFHVISFFATLPLVDVTRDGQRDDQGRPNRHYARYG